MEKISFDSGIRQYRMQGGILRFNPADPNIYARFMDALEQIETIEQQLVESARAQVSDAQTVVQLMAKADKEMKECLNRVFGEENDFHKLLCGVNLLAVAENGERVVTNLFSALQPILIDGANRCAGKKVSEAVQKARARRAAQV